VPFDELPNKMKKRIEKRKAKREQLKVARKFNVNMDQPLEKLFVKYRKIYGDSMSEDKL
jgi:hypothetical protein